MYFDFIQDLFLGTLLFLVIMLLFVIITNSICRFLESFKIPITILLFIQLFLIISFLYILRYYLGLIVEDRELFNSITSLAGPVFAITSLYFSPVLKSFSSKFNFK
jgi:hypothetical protein